MHKGISSWIAFVLLVIGGLNWGLVGIFNFDLVAWVFGAGSIVARIVYILVAVSALWLIFAENCRCKECSK